MINFKNFPVTKEDFLHNYWNKKTLFIPKANDELIDILDRNIFLEMAQEEDIESRLVLEKDETKLFHGPLKESEIKLLKPDNKWTLLIHEANLFIDELGDAAKSALFTEHWKFDDIMISYSSKDSSLGAHTDNYGVFIYQSAGQREWQIQHNPDMSYIENLPIKRLQRFTPDVTYFLNPGDMLYIPPKVAHMGTSLTESTSLSLGFKALEWAGIIDDMATEYMSMYLGEFYSDLNITETSHPFLLSSENIEKIESEFYQGLKKSGVFKKALTKHLGRPRSIIAPPIDIPSLNDLMELAKINALIFLRDIRSRPIVTRNAADQWDLTLYETSITNLSEQSLEKIQKIFLTPTHQEITWEKDETELLEKLYPLFCSGDFYLAE